MSQARSQVRGPWLRIAPLLLRQGLEVAVSQRLVAHGVEERASMKAKLLCLAEVDGSERAAEATWLWERLSECCHYGAYQLDATLDDVTDWSDRCVKLASVLDGWALDDGA